MILLPLSSFITDVSHFIQLFVRSKDSTHVALLAWQEFSHTEPPCTEPRSHTLFPLRQYRSRFAQAHFELGLQTWTVLLQLLKWVGLQVCTTDLAFNFF